MSDDADKVLAKKPISFLNNMFDKQKGINI